jgi:hypothetical protein
MAYLPVLFLDGERYDGELGHRALLEALATARPRTQPATRAATATRLRDV